MKMMVEAFGTDIMGVCLDSGNPVWMLEDPHFTLETLIPYAETSHVRDSAVWKVPEGIAVRWVNMGEGNVDIDGWIRKFVQAKPGLPIIFENLVSGAPADPQDLRPGSSGTTGGRIRRGSSAASSRSPRRARRSRPTPRPEGKTAGQQKIDDMAVCIEVHARAVEQDVDAPPVGAGPS